MKIRARAIAATALAALLAIAVSPAVSRAITYKVDPSHTTVGFKIRHLFTNVAGRFDTFEGTDRSSTRQDSAPRRSRARSRAASINTNNEKRDTHLRRQRLLRRREFIRPSPSRAPRSPISIAPRTPPSCTATLTMHGVEKPIVLDVAFSAPAKTPGATRAAGFTATTTINRKDFGVNWNETLDTGGLLIGEDVEVEINVEGFVVS